MLEDSKIVMNEVKKEICEGKVWLCSFLFIACFMIYVVIVSLLINLVLESYMESMYYAFQNMNVFDFEFWVFTLVITIIYMILNFVVTYFAYRITFFKWSLTEENKRAFLRNVMVIFPILLFFVSFLSEGEWFPIILNTITQIYAAYFWRDKIKLLKNM